MMFRNGEGGIFLQQKVFIINGSGGVGKDSVCKAAARFWSTRNISSITPVLEVARAAGWDGRKTPAARRLLSQLKAACTAFNDLPFSYCMEQYNSFLQSSAEILFVHIREPEEIARFREAVHTPCAAILVRRRAVEQTRQPLGNRSDDNVAQYDAYDAIFDNDGALDALPDQVYSFFLPFMTDESYRADDALDNGM